MKSEVLEKGGGSRVSSRSVKQLQMGPERPKSPKVRKSARIAGVRVGRLVELGEMGEPLVDFSGNFSANPVPSLSVLALDTTNVGRKVILMFEEGDPLRPIVMGVVADGGTKSRDPVEFVLDQRKIVFTAEREIVLRCGKASLTLTRAGKVLIRGAYLLSRSSGVNRIKGGSVQIN